MFPIDDITFAIYTSEYMFLMLRNINKLDKNSLIFKKSLKMQDGCQT